MNSTLEYKGYCTRIEFDADAMLLHGKIEGINDLVTFESEDSSRIEAEFHAAVDDYLDFCKEVGKEPEKEYRGLFNVRIRPDLHKRIAAEAVKKNISMNALVEQAISSYVDIIDNQSASPVAP
ncbi:type II toxin-antitoxin system HicB family antitoxin [Selenomonas sp. AB3002]|jgi:predicted HicB family RNase H-like nuclease|uniref:type II toxin-antitoxin system HicB family antitoxin n=1 Tax=Selenomonas sp. AB3002 TaxID=1392502 RepID=UPI0004985046